MDLRIIFFIAIFSIPFACRSFSTDLALNTTSKTPETPRGISNKVLLPVLGIAIALVVALMVIWIVYNYKKSKKNMQEIIVEPRLPAEHNRLESLMEKLSTSPFDAVKINIVLRQIHAEIQRTPAYRRQLINDAKLMKLLLSQMDTFSFRGENFRETETSKAEDCDYNVIKVAFVAVALAMSATASIIYVKQRKKLIRAAAGAAYLDRARLPIGGLDQQIETINTRVIVPRQLPEEVVSRFGIQHARGIILHGPPGTGKTLLAREIGRLLNAKMTVIKGPEILDMWVGSTERQLRAPFEAATRDMRWQWWGTNPSLHLIVIDEIDALCKPRGRGFGGSSDVNDNIVNTLLCSMDGIDQLNNILVIGTTNRLDMIDQALLRPCRFDVKIEIGLPDKAGRHQILQIATELLRRNNKLDDDVDLLRLATETEKYTGTMRNISFEIKEVVSGSAKGADLVGFVGEVTTSSLKKLNSEDLNAKYNMRDFKRVLTRKNRISQIMQRELLIIICMFTLLALVIIQSLRVCQLESERDSLVPLHLYINEKHPSLVVRQ